MYNEANRLFRTFKDIEKFKKLNFIKDIEYIFVDDGSTDNSIKKINDFFKNKKNFNFKVVKIKTNTGKGYALKKGVIKAKKDWILTLDVDISVSLLQIKKWINKKLINNKNVVYFGSRNLKNSDIEFKFHRKILGIIFSFLLNILFNINIKDTQCGFKLYKKKIAKRIFKNIKDTGFVHDVEVVLYSKKFNYGLEELPVKWIHRNESKLNLYVDTFKMFFKLFIIKKNLFSLYS
jgi:dolichyl-phosphate beta-glucosyltransferase